VCNGLLKDSPQSVARGDICKVPGRDDSSFGFLHLTPVSGAICGLAEQKVPVPGLGRVGSCT
jgi:hypothetical protein